jgi:hypothetical protein
MGQVAADSEVTPSVDRPLGVFLFENAGKRFPANHVEDFRVHECGRVEVLALEPSTRITCIEQRQHGG